MASSEDIPIEKLMEEICWDVMQPIPHKNISIDPVKYEIAVHRVAAILREGSYALVRTSGSPIVSEVGEYMFAIYDAEGHAAYVTAGVLAHLIGTEGGIKYIRATFGDDINDEDQFILNDPYVLGIHTPDVLLAKPIFFKGELLCWVASLTHSVEIGAKNPGGVSDSADIFQEGIRLPGFKIVSNGKRADEVFRLIKRGVRNPDIMELDIRAKIAGNNVVHGRLNELISNEGPVFIKDLLHKMIQDTEERARDRVRQVPDGIWRNRAYGDHNGRQWQSIWCDVVATKSGDTIHLDLSNSSPQQAGPVNTLLAGSIGAIFSVLVSTIFWDLTWNKGIVTPLRVTIPQGSMFNPSYPAPCFAAPPTTMTLLSGTVTKIVSEMCLAAGLQDTVCAPWDSSHSGCFMGGRSQFGRLEGTVLFDANGGGTGATLSDDGDDTSAFILAPGAMMADVESYEAKYPLMYLFRRKRQNSGGYGQFQGGLGGEAAVMIHGSQDWQVGFRSIGQKVTCTSGILGGYPANSHLHAFVFRSAQPGSRLTAAELNQLLTLGDLLKHPGAKVVPPMCPSTALSEGDIYIQCWSGGGGCGDPLHRDLHKILSDLTTGKISVSLAREIYGVVISGEEIDTKQTAKLRDRILSQRQSRWKSVKEKSKKETDLVMADPLGSFHPGTPCLACGSKLEGLLPNADRKASDVMHEWVDDDWMFYREFYCPRCWSLVSVNQISRKEK
jgi:N-methylhydantoinase B